MEEARQEANQRIMDMETECEPLGEEREFVLEEFTKFIYSMKLEVIDYSRPLEQHEKVFRNYQTIRECIKKRIGQERMYCLLGTDKDVIDLYQDQKLLLLGQISK